jgi:hypothetical protein
MRWEDERYVRLYTRDTVDWLGLSFLAQGLFCLILRKVDRAGILELGKHGRKSVAVAIGHGHQWAMLEEALEELIRDGCVRIEGETLVVPNFIEAQEAVQSDAQRKRVQRERARAKVTERTTECHAPNDSRDTSSRDVTPGHDAGQKVTPGHAESRAVTRGHSSLAEPSVPSDPPSRPPRAARVGVGHPAFEAIDHWRTKAWPRISPAPCPAVLEREAAGLSRLVLEHTVPSVVAAMDRAASDDFWRDKLTLDVFVEKFARFLPRHGAGGPPPPARPRCIGQDENGQPIFEGQA